MAKSYTRQSSFSNGDVIDAPLFNAEFDQLESVFSEADGHNHDGTTGGGAAVPLIQKDNHGVRVDTNNPLEPKITFTIDGVDVFSIDSAVLADTTQIEHTGFGNTMSLKDYLDTLGDPDNLITDTSDLEHTPADTGVTVFLKSHLDELDTTINSIQSDIATTDSNVATLDIDLTTLEGRVDSLDVNKGSFETRVTTLETEMNAVEGRVTTLETEMNAVEGRATTLETEMNAVEGRATTLETEMNAVEGRATTLETEMNAVESSIVTLDNVKLEAGAFGLGAQTPSYYPSGSNMNTLGDTRLFISEDQYPTNWPAITYGYPAGLNLYRSSAVHTQLGIGWSASQGGTIRFRASDAVGGFQNWQTIWDSRSLPLTVDGSNNVTLPSKLTTTGQGTFNSPSTRVIRTNYNNVGGGVWQAFEIQGTERWGFSTDTGGTTPTFNLLTAGTGGGGYVFQADYTTADINFFGKVKEQGQRVYSPLNKNTNSFRFNTSQSIVKTAPVTYIRWADGATGTLTFDLSTFSENDIVVINKIRSLGSLTIVTTNGSLFLPNGTLTTSDTLSGGYSAQITLAKTSGTLFDLSIVGG